MDIFHSTRRSAREKDRKYYFTGKPCPYGHIVPRFTSNGGCTACLSKLVLNVREVDTTKPCIRCGAVFSGRQCRLCRRVLGRKWASRNRSYLADIQRKRVAVCRAYIRDLKSHPCADCKHSFPWYVTEFDHRNGRDKLVDPTVSQLIGTGTLAHVKAEVAKCDLVCANCHRIRTHERAVKAGRRIA